MKKKMIDVEKLALLSGFEISKEEQKIVAGELEEFLQYAKILDSAPCADLEPAAHAIEKENFMREDRMEKWGKASDLLNCGPALQETSYIVPPQRGRSGEKDQESSGRRYVENYEAVIGLEVHAQLKTKSKLFCRCSTEFGREPNDNTCPVCSGHPGTLPVLNKEAVSMAMIAGIAVGAKIESHSVFARKNYFYPDSPKAYQISQFELPICSGGYIPIECDGKTKKVRLNRIHIEEDAGKMVHVGAPGIWGAKASAVDFNRTSVPLIEIVSEPDLETPREAKEYVTTLRAILVSLGICDGNMQEGSLRCDANVSIRKRGEKELGVKTEIKNMNSFKAVERALIYEIERQKKLVQQGKNISQETRLWDDSSQRTCLMRSKEQSHDYRYFPDPDLMPLEIDKQWIEHIRQNLPALPEERMTRYIKDYQLQESEAKLFVHNPEYADYFEESLKHFSDTRKLANWFFSELLGHSSDIAQLHIKPKQFAALLTKIEKKQISGKMAKTILKDSFTTGKSPEQIIEDQGLKQITDPKAIAKMIKKILSEKPELVKQYQAGKKQVFGFLVGQVMKASQGKAAPGIVNKILKEKLEG